jgi:hypothetical protein
MSKFKCQMKSKTQILQLKALALTIEGPDRDVILNLVQDLKRC